MKFIQYFVKEAYGYHEFEAKNREEAEKMMDNYSTITDLNRHLRIKSNYWKMTELEEVKKSKVQS